MRETTEKTLREVKKLLDESNRIVDRLNSSRLKESSCNRSPVHCGGGISAVASATAGASKSSYTVPITILNPLDAVENGSTLREKS
jgi:hypothetical protein